MIIDKVFLSYAISTTALILILLVGPIILREGQVTIEKQSVSNGEVINRTLDLIQERTNIQLSQFSMHTDRELGDLNGNLSLLIHIVLDNQKSFKTYVNTTDTKMLNLLENISRGTK